MSNPPKYSTERAAIPLPTYEPTDLEHFCAPVIHMMTGKVISRYKELSNDPETSEAWITAFGKEFGGLAQGDSMKSEKGSTAIFVVNHDKRKNIQADRKITYGRLVVDYREQKTDPHKCD